MHSANHRQVNGAEVQLTNAEWMDLIYPTNENLPYMYDSFKWDHCRWGNSSRFTSSRARWAMMWVVVLLWFSIWLDPSTLSHPVGKLCCRPKVFRYPFKVSDDLIYSTKCAISPTRVGRVCVCVRSYLAFPVGSVPVIPARRYQLRPSAVYTYCMGLAYYGEEFVMPPWRSDASRLCCFFLSVG